MASSTRHRHTCPPPAPQARRGPVGVGLPRAAERQRAVQEGRQPAQRPRPDREHLRAPRIRLDRRRRPARPLPLVGPVHAAQAGHRRRQDRDPRARGARRRALHAPRAHRRRPAQPRAAAHGRRHLGRVRPRHRRPDRPAERPVPLDRRPRRPHDLEPARVRRPVDAGGVRRLPPRHPRLPRRRRLRRRDHRRHVGDRRDREPVHRRPRVLATCRASSSPRSAATPATTSCRRSTTSPSSVRSTPSTVPASTCGSAAACRPTRCSRSASAPGCRSRTSPRSGRASSASSATTATAGCAPAHG